jgi:hypothetical protein
MMLLVQFHDGENNLTIQLEGRLVGEFAEEVRDLVMRGEIRRNVIVDLSEVTFVDAVGEAILSWLKRIGAEFVAEALYPRHVCERLRLPFAVRRNAQLQRKPVKKQASSDEVSLRDVVETGSEVAERAEQDTRPREPSPAGSGPAEQTIKPHPARDTTGEAF